MECTNEYSPRIGYVLLEDATFKHKAPKDFAEKRYEHPSLAKVVAVSKPDGDGDLIPFDERIVEGAIVLKPVAAKQEFPSGDGRKLYCCHHSDIRVFFKRKNDGV